MRSDLSLQNIYNIINEEIKENIETTKSIFELIPNIKKVVRI